MFYYDKLDLFDHTIYYKIYIIKNAKNISLRINNRAELRVTVPNRYLIENAKKLLNDKKIWIHDTLKKIKQKNDEFLFLGEKLEMNKIQSSTYTRYHHFELKNNILSITGDFTNNLTDSILYKSWLKISAKEYIPPKVSEYSRQYNMNFNKLNFRDSISRYGSCSQKNNLTFSINLMKFRKEIIDYVIVHELCHTKEHNHSKNFWNLVETIIPDYRKYRSELKEN